MSIYAFGVDQDPEVGELFADPSDILPKMDMPEQCAYLSACGAIDEKQRRLGRPARLSDFGDRDHQEVSSAERIGLYSRDRPGSCVIPQSAGVTPPS